MENEIQCERSDDFITIKIRGRAMEMAFLTILMGAKFGSPYDPKFLFSPILEQLMVNLRVDYSVSTFEYEQWSNLGETNEIYVGVSEAVDSYIQNNDLSEASRDGLLARGLMPFKLST